MSNEYAVKRRIKHHKLRRQARRGEILVRRIYKFCRFIFVLFIFYSAYRLGATHFWYLPQDIYEKQSVHLEILGNQITPKNKIIAEMKKIPLENEPLYKINPAPIAHQIEQLPPVKRAYIRRYWLPARLVVMVEEVTPAITISPKEDAPDIAAFAITGELIPREYLPLNIKQKVPRILTYGTKGDDYENWDIERITKLYMLAKHIEEYSGEQVEYIDIRNPHNAFAKITSVKLKLGEIDESLQERIKPIKDILPQIKPLIGKIQYVDLSWKESKYLKME